MVSFYGSDFRIDQDINSQLKSLSRSSSGPLSRQGGITRPFSCQPSENQDVRSAAQGILVHTAAVVGRIFIDSCEAGFRDTHVAQNRVSYM
jgi:hypothetical protein